MKQILFLIFFPLLLFSQTQIGNDIDSNTVGDFSGFSVSLSKDGNTVAIGTNLNAGNEGNSGHIRIYSNQNGTWSQIGDDIFGDLAINGSARAISLSGDGNVVAIGAYFNSVNGPNSGQVRIYENQNNVWTQLGSEINGDAAGDSLGRSVSLSGNGSIVAIGAPFNVGNGSNSGQVRIYENQGGIWTQIGNDINGDVAGDSLGYSLSLSSEGNTIAIGSPFNDVNGLASGKVSIYKKENDIWSQIGNDINGEAAGDISGRAISISSDGNIVAIGAHLNDGNGEDSGHVRIYENDNNIWTQIGSDINSEASGDHFGIAVSLSSDGSIIAIGANFNDGNGSTSGQVRVFKNQINSWNQIGIDIDGEAAGDHSGFSVSLSNDGNTVAIGAPINSGSGINSGHVRVYDLSESLSTDEFKLSNINLYPNPTKNQFVIQLENNFELRNVNIYNNLGQLLLTSKNIMVDISTLSTGLYIVKIETNKGKGSKKLIIE